MENEDLLNAVQQVLRGVTVCLALEQRADMGRLASALQAFADSPDLAAPARTMLMDLATGLGMIASAGARKV